MRHQKTRHKLSRTSAHRKALLMNLSKEIIEHERIETSAAKARAVKPEVERLITLAKRRDLHARRQELLMNLSKEIIEHERIETSAAKARAVKPEVERLITLAKRRDLHARRQ